MKAGVKMKMHRNLSILSFALLLLLGGLTRTQADPLLPVLFGSAHIGPDGPSSLYRIDPTSGEATLVGPIGFIQVGSMDFDRSGALFAVGRRPGGDGEQVLLTINPTTGAGTEVGLLFPVTAKIAQDISFRNLDGVLFATAAGNIYTIDPTTGATTLVGDTGSFLLGNGLAFSSSDTLYTVDNLTLRIVNQETGAETFVSNMHYPNPPLDFAPRANGMDFDNSTGILWASVVNGGTYLGETVPLSNHLTTIDITTGNVTYIGPTIRGLDAIAVQPVPEPATILLLGTGLVGVAMKLRKRLKK